MLLIIEKIFSIFIISGIGVFLNKSGLVKEKEESVLSTLLVSVCAPCMIVASVFEKKVEANILGMAMWSFSCALVLYVILFFVGLWCTKLTQISKKDASLYAYSFPSTNSGFLGMPITMALFGTDAFFNLIIQNFAMNFYLYLIGILFLHLFSGEGHYDKSIIINMLKNPCMIASLLGLFFMAIKLKMPSVVLDLLNMVGNTTTPIAMIYTGIMLGSCSLGKLMKDKAFVIMLIAKMVLCPVIAYLVVNWMPVNPVLKISMVFGFTFPVAAMVAPLAEKENANSELASKLVAITTLVSVVTIPISALFLTWNYM